MKVFDRTEAADVSHFTSMLPESTEVWVRVSDLENGGRPLAALITGEDIVMSLDWTDGHAATNEFVFAEPGGNGHWETGVTI